ncbi:MAG TPA: DUF465 domain-containing protein, partial [Sphingopyxis sp.]|nr:DUF465 domain-containing protein [Sphingopyxis sp.]
IHVLLRLPIESKRRMPMSTSHLSIHVLLRLPIESKRRMPMSTSHLSTLKSRHADLDAKIANEERRPAPDTGVLAQLKKQKLKLKEEMLAIA